MSDPSLEDVRAAVAAIRGSALRTPLVRVNVDDAPAEIHLKLENLQPIGSFKIRGAVNAISRLGADVLSRGVLTASAGTGDASSRCPSTAGGRPSRTAPTPVSRAPSSTPSTTST